MSVPLATFQTQNANRNLAAGATIFTDSHDFSAFDLMAVFDIEIGDGTDDLTADSETTLTFQISNGGVLSSEITATVPNGQGRRRTQTDPILWKVGETLAITCTSSNAGDTNVDVTVAANANFGEYEEGFIWIGGDHVSATAGTVFGVNGTRRNPTTLWDDARSMGAANKFRRVKVIEDFKHSTGASSLDGNNLSAFVVDLNDSVWRVGNSQQPARCTIKNGSFHGAIGETLTFNSNTGGLHFENMGFAAFIFATKFSTFKNCRFSSLTLGANGNGDDQSTTFHSCRPGSSQGRLLLDAAGVAGNNAFLDWSGNVELSNMTGTLTLMFAGQGRITFDTATCTAGMVNIAGMDVVDENGNQWENGAGKTTVNRFDAGVGRISQAALAQFVSDDTGVSIGSEHAQSVAKHSQATSIAVVGPGSRELTWTVDDGSDPIVGAEAWITTDAAGTTVVAGTFITDDAGVVRAPGSTAKPLLDDDTVYYGWLDHVNHTSPAIQFRYSSADSEWQIWNGSAYVAWN